MRRLVALMRSGPPALASLPPPTFVPGPPPVPPAGAIPDRLRAALLLMQRHGLRASEVVRIEGRDVGPDGSIYVRATKGSTPRTLADPEIAALLGGPGAATDTAPRIWYTYSVLYRAARELGWATLPAGRSHARVTHAGRASVVQELHDAGESHAEIAAALGIEAATVPHYLVT